MRRQISKSIVRQHLTSGIVLLGLATIGSIDAYGEYIDHRRIRDEIDHAEPDWSAPDRWYKQAQS
ncbi:hypothetical protein [Nocardia salmonicida]|uniref:hypothetical protein n=1 Tax=Nocardia salmonicida TaxID=53431 RepID=UPI000AB1C937|nr:hypothetical protein [Nocardia salmonicida]